MSGELKIRAVIGFLPGDPYPTFAGAMDDGIWEVIDDEEWQKIIKRWKEEVAGDWMSYDWREVWISFPTDASLFAAPEIKATLSEGKP